MTKCRYLHCDCNQYTMTRPWSWCVQVQVGSVGRQGLPVLRHHGLVVRGRAQAALAGAAVLRPEAYLQSQYRGGNKEDFCLIIRATHCPPGLSLHPPLGKLIVDPGPVKAGGDSLQGADLVTRTYQVPLTMLIISFCSLLILLCID